MNRRRAVARSLPVAALALCLAGGARAQESDLGGSLGGGGGGGGGTGGGAGTGASSGAVPELTLPPSGSLLQSGPAQPGGLGTPAGLLGTGQGESLRDRIGQALGLQAPGEAGQPTFQFTPAINLQQGWTSNAINVPGTAGGQSAFMTIVNPSLAVSADSQRVQGGLVYAPSLFEYEPNRGQSQVAQNLSAHVHAIVIPDTLFIDMQGFAGEQTITGGFGPTGTTVQNNSNTAQDYSFSLMPYLQHRFGDIGVGEIGGSFSQTAQLVPGNTVAAVQPGLPATALPSQYMTMTEEHVAFSSGDGFGRWVSNALISLSQDSGTGVFTGAYRNTAEYEAGYAITHSFTVLATIGWDDLHYAGLPPITIDTPLWNVGFQWTPNADSQVIARYGRKDGIDAPFLSATYVPTPRTRLNASYSVMLSTDQEQLRNDLANSTTDASGNPVSAVTGESLLSGNNFLGLFAGVYRLESGQVGGSLLLDRDTFQVSVNRQRQTTLNTVPGSIAGLTSLGTFGSVTWQHDLSDAVKTTMFVQYGVSQSVVSAFSQSSDVLTGSAQVSYALSDTLSTNLIYSHTQSSYRSPIPGYSVDMVLAGIQKRF